MNLRYKELAEQAWNSVRDEIGDVYIEDGLNWDFLHAYDKRYAELIVRECIEWCDAHATINGTAQQVRDSIKQHFGVEE